MLLIKFYLIDLHYFYVFSAISYFILAFSYYLFD